MVVMGSPAVIIELGPNGGTPIRYQCSGAFTCSKGTLLSLTDANKVCASDITLIRAPFAGIAAMEKDGSDTGTEISAYTTGIFDLVSDTCNAGALLAISSANCVHTDLLPADTFLSGGMVGKALEAATGSETIRVKLLGF